MKRLATVFVAALLGCSTPAPPSVTAVTDAAKRGAGARNEPPDPCDDLEALNFECGPIDDLVRVVSVDNESGKTLCEAKCVGSRGNDGTYRSVLLGDPNILTLGWYQFGRRSRDWRVRVGDMRGLDLEVVYYLNGPRHGPYRTFYPDGSPHVSGMFHREAPDGRWLEQAPDGVVLSEENFVRGKHVGLQITRHPNGQKASERNFDEAGRPDGRWCSWLPAGTEIECTLFADGTGVAREFDDEGRLIHETPYTGGEPNGIEVTITSDRRVETPWVDGEQTGISREYTGECLVKQRSLSNGRNDGPYFEQVCNEAGIVQTTSGAFCAGNFCGLWVERSSTGDVLRVTEYDQLSMKLAEAQFDPGGKLAEFWTLDETLRLPRAACYQAIAGGLCCDIAQQAYAVNADCLPTPPPPDTTEL